MRKLKSPLAGSREVQNSRTRTSHTSSPTNKSHFNATQVYAPSDLDSSFKLTSHGPHFSLKVPANIASPTGRTAHSYKAKFQECTMQLNVMQAEYQKALAENEQLRLQARPLSGPDDSSCSTMSPGYAEDLDLRQSLVNEIEDLYELLSNAHMSMAILMNGCDSRAEKHKSVKTELNTLKFQSQMNPPSDSQIQEVLSTQRSDELTRINDEMKASAKEKQRLELRLEELLKKKAELEIENKGMREKIRVLNGDEEVGSAAEVLKKLNLARSLLAQSEEKAEKYEKFIQKKILKNKR